METLREILVSASLQLESRIGGPIGGAGVRRHRAGIRIGVAVRRLSRCFAITITRCKNGHQAGSWSSETADDGEYSRYLVSSYEVLATAWITKIDAVRNVGCEKVVQSGNFCPYCCEELRGGSLGYLCFGGCDPVVE